MKELKTQKISPSVFDSQDGTLFTWLGMAGVLVNARGTILLVDPLITLMDPDDPFSCESGYRLKLPLPVEAKDLPRVDAVLYTHADNDHFGRLSAQVFGTRHACRFIAPPPVADELLALGIDRDRITVARDFGTFCLGPVEVVVTPALHDWQERDPWGRGDCSGYLVKTPDGTIWHPGDTRLIDPLLDVRDVDVLFFDVADVDAHLGPWGSARLAESSGAGVLVAYHYGTFDLPPGGFGSCDPEDSLPLVADLEVDFLQPDPGEILWLLHSPSLSR